MTRDCEHGHLARSCDICDLTDQRDQLLHLARAMAECFEDGDGLCPRCPEHDDDCPVAAFREFEKTTNQQRNEK